MVIKPLLVHVPSITCDCVSRSCFDETELSQAAQLILQGGGIVTPLILRRQGLEHYSVEKGFFEYYAAVRAHEIDPIEGETIDAYVIDKTNEAILVPQVKMFRGHTL